MFARFIARLRVEVIDARTAISMGEYKYALPTPLFNLLHGRS